MIFAVFDVLLLVAVNMFVQAYHIKYRVSRPIALYVTNENILPRDALCALRGIATASHPTVCLSVCL